MQEYNIIGDIHGNYALLMSLARKMPDVPFFSLGDMIDRGPKSLDVLRFFMKEGNRAILGNHEHMMLDLYHKRRIYGRGLWLSRSNGGYQTLKNFAPDLTQAWEVSYINNGPIGKPLCVSTIMAFILKTKNTIFPEDIMEWVDSLPIYYEDEGLFLSHAPRNPYSKWADLKESKKDRMRLSGPSSNLLWNIGAPGYIEGITQIHGHVITRTGEPYYYKDDDKGIYGINIDTLGTDPCVLTGIHWPSLKIYQTP